jgi:hypothetical protein
MIDNGLYLPNVTMPLRRLLESRMGNRGKREFIQVLVAETADPETGEIATASFKPHPPWRRNPGHLRGGRGASCSPAPAANWPGFPPPRWLVLTPPLT